MAHKKRKILVITGTRAEFGYLRPVLREIRKSKRLALRLLVTGMHTLKRFGDTQREVKKEFSVDAVISVRKNDSMLESLAKEIVGIERYCRKERPDLILVIADRDEGLAGAIVAGHLGIPLAHLSAGSTSGYGVDEAIRHSITKFAHVHFAWTKGNGRRLAAMGEERWRIHVPGSTAFDALRATPLYSRRELARILTLREDLSWLVILQHPTPLDLVPLTRQLEPTLRATIAFKTERIIVYPNSDTGSAGFIRTIEKLKHTPHTSLYKTLPHRIFLSLLKHSQVLIGNSSSGIEEAGFFHLPVVDVGGRQRDRECGANVLHVSYNEKAIRTAIHKALSSAFVRRTKKVVHPYYGGNASKKIVRVLERLPLNDKLKYKQVPIH